MFLRKLFLSLTTLCLLAACTSAAPQTDISQRPIRVTTTIGMVTDIVQNVGGERVVVQGLMGPGVDPHLYKASESDVLRLSEADVVFYSGLHLEAAMTSVFEDLAGRVTAVAVTDPIDRSLLTAPPEFAGQYDPHVWFDVSLWMQTVNQVRDTLSTLDPGSAEYYAANATAYLAQLEELDAYVRAEAAKIPAEQRVLVTAHDAFGYFGRAYGFEVRGLQGISTETQAGTADVQALADFIVARQIPAVFVETSVPPRTIEAVQAAVQAQGFAVKIGGHLYSDAMGDPGTPEGTYIGMVKHNIDTIVSALTASTTP